MKRRFCLTLDLKDDPLLIGEYKRYHEQIWPEITKSLRDAGIEDAEIYLFIVCLWRWPTPPPLVTLLPRVLACRRSDPLGRCPEPTYALRWPAPPQAGSLETSAESIRPFASREPDPVYRDRSRPARAGHYAAQHRRSILPRPAPVQILRPAMRRSRPFGLPAQRRHRSDPACSEAHRTFRRGGSL